MNNFTTIQIENQMRIAISVKFPSILRSNESFLNSIITVKTDNTRTFEICVIKNQMILHEDLFSLIVVHLERFKKVLIIVDATKKNSPKK